MGGASTTLVRSLLSMMKCANSPFQSTRASMIAVLLFACACSASYEGVVNTPEDHHSQMVHPDVDGLNEMELGQGPVMQGQQPVQVPAAQMQNQPQMMGAGMGLNSQFHYSGSQSAGKNGKEDFYGPQYISTFHQQPGMMGGMGMGMGMGMMGGAMMGFPHYVHVAAPFPFLPQPYAYEHTWGMGLGMTGQYQPKYYGDYGHRGWHIRGGFNHQQWGRKLNGAKKYQTTGEWYHSGKRKGKQGPDVQMYGEHGYGHWRYGYRKKSMRHGYGQPMVGAWRQGWSDYFKPYGRMGFGGRYGWGYHVPFPKAGLSGKGSVFPHPANLGYGPVPQHKHGGEGWQFHKAGRYGWGGGYDGADLRIDQGKNSDCDGPC